MNNQTIKILIIDDDPADSLLVNRYLSQIADWSVEFEAFEDPDLAMESLASRTVDVIFLDYVLGPTNGLEILRHIRLTGCRVPVIMLTGAGDEEIAVSTMRLGAADYLVKGSLSTEILKRAIVNALDKHRLQMQIEEQSRRLEKKVLELEAALAHVRQLQGILPICSFCKRIRDDDSFWGSVEEYIQSHSEVEFSHSVCPECMQKEYPELASGLSHGY